MEKVLQPQKLQRQREAAANSTEIKKKKILSVFEVLKVGPAFQVVSGSSEQV